MTRSAPRRANSRAISRPMPVLAPVTKATLPFRIPVDICGYCSGMRSPVFSTILLTATASAQATFAPAWIPQQSDSTASLRGVHAVNARVVWASGTKGTVLRTTDGGMTWQTVPVAGAADLDFRAIHAFDERTALALSAGLRGKSRIYKTTHGRATRRLPPPNTHPQGFWDAMAFLAETPRLLLDDPANS